MKYYSNPYINFYVRLFREAEFKGKPVIYVAKYAGNRWRSMSDADKACYYRMAEKASGSKKFKGGKISQKTGDHEQRKQEEWERSQSEICSADDSNQYHAKVMQRRAAMSRQVTPSPASSCENMYDLSTQKADRAPKKFSGKSSVKRRLLYSSDSEPESRKGGEIQRKMGRSK